MNTEQIPTPPDLVELANLHDKLRAMVEVATGYRAMLEQAGFSPAVAESLSATFLLRLQGGTP